MSSTKIDLKFSDLADERLYFKKYSQLPPKESTTIRFIDHNNHDYFTALGSDADLIAEKIYRTQSVIKHHNQTKYVTISPQNFKELLNYCLQNHFKVEVYHSKTFQLISSGTAGNLDSLSEEFDIDFDFRDGSSSSIAAIKLGNKVGVCVIADSIVHLSEFEDNELYSNLESLLIQLGVKEVVIPANVDNKKFFQMLEKLNDLVVSAAKSFPKDNEQDISKLLDTENLELSLAAKGINSLDYALALSCCGALIDYLDLLNGDKTFEINKYNLSTFMKLDSSTMKALNILPNGTQKAITSIFELFKCKTLGGSRLLSQWLKQPLIDLSLIEERQELVKAMIDDTSLRVEIQEFLSKVPDINRLLKKIGLGVKRSGAENKKLNEVVNLYQLVLLLPNLTEILTIDYYAKPLKKDEQALSKFCELVETTIDLDTLFDKDYKIKPDFDPSLSEISNNMESAFKAINDLYLEAGDDLNLDTASNKLKLEQHQTHGWCMRVTRNDSRVLRGKSQYKELQTVKSGVFFTTMEMKRLSQEYTKAYDEYNVKQSEVIKEILSLTLTYEPVLQSLSSTLAHLDVITCFATTAMLNSYTQPKLFPFESSRKINLIESRHPLLEVQDDINFISNDVKMDDKHFAIITGPNMGGKSTYIRQIGTIALMAQVGSFIPANDGAELPIFDAILSRVGAGDSQLKGLSTFMIEMLETSSILATATANSLIIIDELGRGTSTYDGFGLAWAISEELIKRKCFAVFATHFHELSQLSEKYDGVENLNLMAEQTNEDITLIYKVGPGISNTSFGISVAEKLHMPEKIVNMAKKKVEELSEEPPIKKQCSETEVREGMSRLREILKEWRNNPEINIADSLAKEPNKFINYIVDTL